MKVYKKEFHFLNKLKNINLLTSLFLRKHKSKLYLVQVDTEQGQMMKIWVEETIKITILNNNNNCNK